MAIGTLVEIINNDHAIISTSSGPEFYVAIKSFIDKDRLEPGYSVLFQHMTQAIIGVLQDDTAPMVSVMKLNKAPTESYADVGGLDQQIQEIKLYEEMGIRPPKDVFLYGVPGMGKTFLTKAVANQSSATFLRVPVRCWFRTHSKVPRRRAEAGAGAIHAAEEHAPSIVSIDKTGAIGMKRYESISGDERKIQRTMLELLNQLDSFDTRGDVKIIMSANWIESSTPRSSVPAE
ncbi:putative 26s protease regulatory subunit 4 [Phellopilus nigrolimitatus]|nr:putative 26s protease regulatory subunit 4 [Phellopilus nigrolimitatus]